MLIRRGGRCYYYRYRRRAGRVVREYVASGPQAVLLAAQEQARLQAEQGARTAWQAHQERLSAADRQLDSLIADLDLLAQASLFTGGYHRHKRGEWRRKRHG
jgi:hypothetical protein